MTLECKELEQIPCSPREPLPLWFWLGIQTSTDAGEAFVVKSGAPA